MGEPRIYRCADDVNVRLDDLPQTRRPDRVLMIDPQHFDVAYILNPHQVDADGELRKVDSAIAREQWEALRALFVDLGLKVSVLEPVPGQLDLVFCANQVMPVPQEKDEPRRVVPSRMASPERAPEVPHVVGFLREQGFTIEPLRGQAERFEGTGDALWHPGRRFLWAGVGPRSCEAAWVEVAERYDAPVALLELNNPLFYHLDTCLSLLDDETCLWHPEAFTEAGRGLIEALFPQRIQADPEESREKLACNAFCPDGTHVIIQAGCDRTNEALADAGFEPLPTDTSEFLKSGGSVFCMKLAY